MSKASLAIDAGSTSIHRCARTTSTRQRTPMSRQPLTGRAFARKFLRRTMAATMSGTSSTGDKFYGIGSKCDHRPVGHRIWALDSNPVEGAKATIYVADDANGRNARKWNAEDYEQEGTLDHGRRRSLQWDTPTGFYQVRVAKEGYDVARTDWLSVLPHPNRVEGRFEVNAGTKRCSCECLPRIYRAGIQPIHESR